MLPKLLLPSLPFMYRWITSTSVGIKLMQVSPVSHIALVMVV